MTIARQYAYGMARLRWVHCHDCHQKLDYQHGSIMADCVERSGDPHLCGGCAGTRAGKEIVKNFAKRLKAAMAATDGGTNG